jgi:hypothetical protein
LARTYSRPWPGHSARTIPIAIPVSPALLAEHPLMRTVLRPYATGDQLERPQRDAIFFLSTDLIEVRATAISSRDPRYVFRLARPLQMDRAVVRTLIARGFCDFTTLSNEVDSSPRRLQASLRRLLSAGIVIQSPPMDRSTDPEEHRHGAHG